MSPARHWSLRRRLSIAVCVVVLALGGAVATTLTVALRDLLLAHIDEDLAQLAARRPGGALPSPYRQTLPFALVVLDPDGRMIASVPSGSPGDPDPVPDVSGLTRDELSRRAGSSFTLPTTAGGSVRAQLNRTPEGYRIVALSLEPVAAATRVVAVRAAATILLAAGLVTLASWWLLRRSFGPVDRMIDDAGRIAAGDHSRPAATGRPGTEVGRLGTALHEMLARLEAADADRRRDAERLRRFVDDASHELRTPITAIAGYAELYQAGGVAPGAPLERAMARISEASERATRLVEDLLALARLEREIGSRSEDTDLEPLVLALAEDTRVTTGREVWADTAGPVVLHADPLWLRQALDNLVHNALTHAPEDRPVTVVLRHDDREAVVTVVDHGPGVGADDRDRVFERFARLDGESGRPARGTGLGLSIVREIVDAHEGRVEVVDTPGGGASFTIRLPRRAPR